jgi:hypothetical protein
LWIFLYKKHAIMRYPAILILLLLISACSSSRQASQGVRQANQVVRQEIQPDRIADSEQLIITGTVKDESGEPVIFASLAVYDNDILTAGTASDVNGVYQLELEKLPQDLAIELSFVGMKTSRYHIGKLKPGLYQFHGTLSDVPFGFACGAYPWRKPLIEMDNMTSGATFTSDQLRRMPAFRGGGN